MQIYCKIDGLVKNSHTVPWYTEETQCQALQVATFSDLATI